MESKKKNGIGYSKPLHQCQQDLVSVPCKDRTKKSRKSKFLKKALQREL